MSIGSRDCTLLICTNLNQSLNNSVVRIKYGDNFAIEKWEQFLFCSLSLYALSARRKIDFCHASSNNAWRWSPERRSASNAGGRWLRCCAVPKYLIISRKFIE